MVDGVNLWQLRTDCLRSLSRDVFEANAQERGEIAASRESYRSRRPAALEARTCVEISNAVFVEDEDSETQHAGKNAA